MVPLQGQNDRSQGKLESQRTHSNGIQQKLEEQYDVAETLRREINDQQQLIKVSRSASVGPVVGVS